MVRRGTRVQNLVVRNFSHNLKGDTRISKRIAAREVVKHTQLSSQSSSKHFLGPTILEVPLLSSFALQTALDWSSDAAVFILLGVDTDKVRF